MHSENEASVLDSRRNDACIFHEGQKVRSHCPLWITHYSAKKTNSALHLTLECLVRISFVKIVFLGGAEKVGELEFAVRMLLACISMFSQPD